MATEDRTEDEHREKMARLKAAKDRLYASKTREKGLLVVHTGTGKGKSTAAWGMVMRCLGHGLRVGVVQFVKGRRETGERKLLAERFPDLVTMKVMGEGFTWETQDRARDVAAATAAFAAAETMMASPDLHWSSSTSSTSCCATATSTSPAVLASLNARREGLHVVVTGRNAPDPLLEAADLVTEMRLDQAPLPRGRQRPARGGVLVPLGPRCRRRLVLAHGILPPPRRLMSRLPREAGPRQRPARA
jgi:cob(I)alamin adenosyltransferase